MRKLLMRLRAASLVLRVHASPIQHHPKGPTDYSSPDDIGLSVIVRKIHFFIIVYAPFL